MSFSCKCECIKCQENLALSYFWRRLHFFMSNLTPFQAKYIAYELTRQRPAGDLGKLAASLQDAQVDLNPHQVDAALFAFKSPLSKGAILADEVGLGKTIEAGIIVAQKWAERKRRLLVICPANLRKQWSQELQDKFHLPSVILEKGSFEDTIRTGNFNPFERESEIVICSFQFAKAKDIFIRRTDWDLVIVDEAHRLRNVYKPQNKIANAIKHAIAEAPKVLLTATPLQNSLLELYGLVSIIDDYAFGDLKSFKSQYSRLTDHATYEDLRRRLEPVCKRTLRRQVIEYINYTNRIPMVEEFFPFDEEIVLYNLVTEYLQRPKLYALPASQRHLITLILRKLLSSSTQAISGTFQAMINRLQRILENQNGEEGVNEVIEDVQKDFDDYKDYEEEWIDEEEEDEDGNGHFNRPLTPDEIEEVKKELGEVKAFWELASSIEKNSKGERLVLALDKGFEKLKELRANQKAIIFTESTRTQQYIKSILEKAQPNWKLVLFNGTNSDPESRRIYNAWLAKHRDTDRVTGSPTADKRQAIVDYFRDEADIMIATEAAAEGINLQFCSLVVNYDLPWNPQRIEQRIGRCHRYGQKFDVVVLNFLNKLNAADQRVYQLLDEKFQLFSGVFGASDEVLGAIGSGLDFEKRIARIYQECRREEDILKAFEELRQELEPGIEEEMESTKRKLLENFDQEVHERLRVNLAQGKEYLGKYERWLWDITQFSLKDDAVFDANKMSFSLLKNPFPDLNIHTGPYCLLQNSEGNKKSDAQLPDNANVYRIGHLLAQRVIDNCKAYNVVTGSVRIHLSGSPVKMSALEPYIGESGSLKVSLLSLHSFDLEEHIVMSCLCADGRVIPSEVAIKLMGLRHESTAKVAAAYATQRQLQAQEEWERKQIEEDALQRNTVYFNEEMDKLEKWAEDMKASLEKEIKDLDAEVRLKKAESRRVADLGVKIRLQREIKELERQRTEKRKRLFEAQDEIDTRKEQLLNDIEARLHQRVELKPLFMLNWQIV